MAERARIVYGLHAAVSVIERRPGDVDRAWCLEQQDSQRSRGLRAQLDGAGIHVNVASRAELDRLCGSRSHQGVALEVRPLGELDVGGLEDLVLARGNDLRLLVLDQVEDPRNLGACLRTADAAGVHCVVIPKARSAKLTPAAAKAAAGAADQVPVAVVPNLARVLRWLGEAGVRVVGADGEAPGPVFDAPLAPPVAIVLGAEGRGLRRLTREACDELVRIPMAGAVESLNVSVAAGILLFELARQAPVASAGGEG